MGAGTTLTVQNGAEVRVGGDYVFEQTVETDIELNAAIVRFEGIGGQQLEVGGTDAGVAGFLAGNFGMGQMRIGTTTQRTSVDLIDVVNNGNRGGGGAAEALYLYGLGGPAGLRILNNSALVLNGINVYAWDPVAGSQVHLNSLFAPGDLRIPYDDGFLQLAPLDFQWASNTGGDFNLGGNWSDGLVPLGSDAGIWNLGSVAGYTVDFGTNVATDSAIIKSDRVTFDLGGFQYSLAGLNATTGLVVGQDTSDNARLTVLNGTLQSKDVRVAAAAGSQGLLTIAPTGRLQVAGDVLLGTGSATLRVAPAGVVNVAGDVVISGNGRLEGIGLTATTVEQQAGSLAPGVMAGIMTLAADYQQSAGVLEIQLGGTDNSNPLARQFDQLLVTGEANLAGALQVSLIDAGAGLFVPNPGDVFEIVTAAGGLTTALTSVSVPALPGQTWLIGQFDNSLLLQVAEHLADFDGDLDVDGADFLAWQRGFGTSSGATKAMGDSDGDGDVDAADLGNWRTRSMPTKSPLAGHPSRELPPCRSRRDWRCWPWRELCWRGGAGSGSGERRTAKFPHIDSSIRGGGMRGDWAARAQRMARHLPKGCVRDPPCGGVPRSSAIPPETGTDHEILYLAASRPRSGLCLGSRGLASTGRASGQRRFRDERRQRLVLRQRKDDRTTFDRAAKGTAAGRAADGPVGFAKVVWVPARSSHGIGDALHHDVQPVVVASRRPAL